MTKDEFETAASQLEIRRGIQAAQRAVTDRQRSGRYSRTELADALPDIVATQLGRPPVDAHPVAEYVRANSDFRRVLFGLAGVEDATEFQRSLTYSHIPALLVNALSQYVAQSPAGGLIEHRRLCRTVEVGNLKPVTLGTVHLSDTEIEASPDGYAGGEIPELVATDFTTDGRPYRYVLRLRLARQLITNGDLDVLAMMVQSARDTLLRTEARKFAEFIEVNPLCGDGSALFIDNVNSVPSGSGGTPSATTLNTAMAAMRRMATPAGSVSGAVGRTLFIPPDVEFSSLSLLNTVDPNGRFGFGLAVSPWLASTTGWYTFANPQTSPTIARLTFGGDEPRFETYPLRDSDGIGLKAELSFGYSAIARLGAYRNPGV